MRVLWAKGKATVGEVADALQSGPPLAYTTVLTMLRILERKGVPGGAVVSGQRKLEANVFTLRLVPSVELPLWRRLSVQLRAGLSLGAVDSEFSFRESVSLANTRTVSREGSDSREDFLVGGYALPTDLYH